MKSAVVTGVSTGIGDGIVGALIAAGWRVFGSVRSAADADAARARHGPNFHALVFDVLDEPAVYAAAAEVAAELGGEVLDGLVNNAGIALSDPLLVQPTADFRRQIDVNLIGPFVVTKAFAPLLGARAEAPQARGRIVNISSVGGRIGAPFLGAYVASKHGIEGMSATLRRELMPYGIDVIVVGPGSVATPIWDKAETAGLGHATGTVWEASARKFAAEALEQGRLGLDPSRIGAVVLTALTAARPATRYAPVRQPLVNWVLPNLLPQRWIDWLIARRFGLTRQT